MQGHRRRARLMRAGAFSLAGSGGLLSASAMAHEAINYRSRSPTSDDYCLAHVVDRHADLAPAEARVVGWKPIINSAPVGNCRVVLAGVDRRCRLQDVQAATLVGAGSRYRRDSAPRLPDRPAASYSAQGRLAKPDALDRMTYIEALMLQRRCGFAAFGHRRGRQIRSSSEPPADSSARTRDGCAGNL